MQPAQNYHFQKSSGSGARLASCPVDVNYLPKKRIFAQLIEEFLALYGTLIFLMGFTRACQWSLS
jgi:hypothetical protein